jgi:diaminopimelate epimerase
MKFTKMHGLGNDFVVVYQKDPLKESPRDLARVVCDRHRGVGADGLVFILPSERADFRMRIFNADGSEAEQCGNAVRCVAKYYYECVSGVKEELTVETGAGIQRVWLDVVDNRVDRVKVDMGVPVLRGEQIPVTIRKDRVVEEQLEVGGRRFAFTAVSMGNPHAVIFVDDAVDFPVEEWGPKIEVHPFFPNKTNVEFITVRSDRELDMRVWERGAGQTMACGSGACASVVASVLTGRTGRHVIVHLWGGDLEIEWSEADGHVYMTGPAEVVFEGRWLGSEASF